MASQRDVIGLACHHACPTLALSAADGVPGNHGSAVLEASRVRRRPLPLMLPPHTWATIMFVGLPARCRSGTKREEVEALGGHVVGKARFKAKHHAPPTTPTP